MKKLENRGAILGLLTLVYVFNFIDRQIVGVLAPFIKADLGLSGTEIGLLTGFVFALFYTIIGIPIASMVDNTKTVGGLKFDRVTIIALSLATWSFFTLLTGFAGGFIALAILRIGVAVGEAGCSPPSHSLLSDLYAPNERARALATYALGIPFGIMIAYFAAAFFAGGGTVDWRLAFVVIGALGIPVAILVKMVVPEPERGRMDGSKVAPLPFKQALGELATIPSYWTMALGIAFASFGSYAVNAFLTLYIYGEPTAEVGAWTGAFVTLPLQPLLIGLGIGNAIFYATGTYLGGVVADHFGKKNVAAYALVPAVTVAIAAVAIAFSWLTTSPVIFFAGLSVYIFFLGFYLGPSFSVAQNLAKVSVRATSTAVFFFVLNLIALGGGPSVTGYLYDRFALSTGSQLEGLRIALLALSIAYALSVVMFLISAKLLPRDWARAKSETAQPSPLAGEGAQA
ncbi:spinster family MFS transporter [Parvularcula lutaonensis]|uniref:Spinster family MFS transporter n=1 Tax=Parvularcula lutaonensis TaxID=491923 RepID=A0ABV7MDS1_9PROT|nr:MFS transporter [Parvularcula lutaonensis]GGY49184.1 MFS transporter [Parvularcula lutaonensis]